MDLDRNGLEVLDTEEAMELLAGAPVARLGLSIDALPVVLPVNIAVDGAEIVVRTAPGTKLDQALAHAVVAVEADQYDLLGHVGWSVLVRGTSRVLALPDELERARLLPLRPWASDLPDRFIAISADLVTGRRIRGWYQPDGHEPTQTLARGGC